MTRVKKYKTARDWYGTLAETSRMTVRVWGGFSALEPIGLVYIGLTGGIAAVPSMKNRKIPGLNMPNPRVMGQMRLMTDLFTQAVKAKSYRFDEKVVVLISTSERDRSFDLDGVATTICDWLEPADKVVGKSRSRRGWGIGLVPNDSWIIPVTVPASVSGLRPDATQIFVRPLSHMRRGLNELVNNFMR